MRTSMVSALSIVVLFVSANTFAQSPKAAGRAAVSPTPAAQVATIRATPWRRIMEEDVVYKNRVWEDVAILRSDNTAECPFSRKLGNVLIGGVLSGKITAYNATNDRFTTVLAKEELVALLSKCNILSAASQFKYKVKEDWLLVQNESVMIPRILGIAPVVPVLQADGTTKEEELFWIYYPYSRDFLVQHKIFSPNSDDNLNWVDVFDNHDFESKITRSTTWSNTLPVFKQ